MEKKFTNEMPTLKELVIPLLTTMAKESSILHRKLIDEKIISNLSINSKYINIKHKNNKNRSEIQYRLAWVRSHLKKLGILHSDNKGNWAISNKDFKLNLEQNCKDALEKYRLLVNAKYKTF